MGRIIKLGFLILLGSILTATTALSDDLTTKKILDNGLTVLVTEMPTSQMVSLYALVKVGSATEGKYLGSGMSHFIEHMMFKGTKKRAVGVVASEIQALGGTINASTGNDYTIYTISVPAEVAYQALDVLSDMLMNSNMDPVEIEKEREVILREMNLHNDNPDRRQLQNIYKTVYLNHPYRHPTIGYKDLFISTTAQELKDFYQKKYSPNNIIISVAGNMDGSKMLTEVETAFKDFKRQYEIMRNLPAEPQQITARYYEDEYATPTARGAIAYPTVSLLNHDLFALDVLAMILGQGKSSRLYARLFKQDRLVFDVTAWNHTPIDPGMFVIGFECDLINFEKIVDYINQEVDSIKKKGILPAELEKAKQQVVSDHIMGNQTTENVAFSKATDEAFTGDYNFSQKYTEGIKRVTNEDIKRVASQYLKDESKSVVVLKPLAEKEIDQESAENKSTIGQIQKIQLNNGLTVLLRNDPTFPIINLQAVFLGGVRQESAEKNGLSQLFASVWLRGTKSKSADQIDEEVDRLAMNLGSIAGRNSMSVSLNALSQDASSAINLLYDIVSNPIFPQAEIDKAKNVQLVNIKQRDDDIFRFSAHLLKELIFKNHPMRFDVNGTKESVEKITREDLINYYKEFVGAANMVVAVYGDFDSNEMIAKLNQTFGLLPRGSFLIKKYNEEPLTKQLSKEEYLPKEQAIVMVGFQGPDLYSKHRYTAEVLTAVLGSSFNGRLFRFIRDEDNQAYTLGGQYLPSLDTGFIYFYALTTPQNVDKVKEKLQYEIRKMVTEPVSQQELSEIKTYLKGSYIGDLQTNSSLAFVTALDEIYALGYETYLNYGKNIDQVTVEDVSRFANEYLDLNKAAVMVTLPTPDQKGTQ